MISSNDKYTSRTPVSGIYTGFVFMFVGDFCFITNYYSFLVSQSPIEFKIFISAIISVVCFGIGSFIPSLRDSGFRNYMDIQKKRKEDVENAKKNGKKLKYPGKWQHFNYKLFRDGSVAEECSESWRKLKRGEPSYSFLKDCNNVQEAVNKHREIAVEISKKLPMLRIYKTYHDCEKFQCFDTGFWFFSILSIILMVVNLYLIYLKGFDFSIILPPVFCVIFYMIHKLCKQKGKDMAHRYLTDINSGWKEIIEEEKRKKEEVKPVTIMPINSPGSKIYSGISVEDSPGAIIGEGNTSNTNLNFFGISELYVKQKLKEAGVSEDKIESINPQIAGIVIECNKEKPDESKLYVFLEQIKKNGGNALLNAFKFLIQTTIGVLMQNLINKVMMSGE